MNGNGNLYRSGDLGWLLEELVAHVPEIRHVIVLSGDGLPVGTSARLTRDDAERFAAIASGFHSLAKGTGRHFGAGGVIQTLVELEDGFLFVVAAGEGSCLAVFSEASADVGLVAYEMARLVKRVGAHLGTPVRGGAPAVSRVDE
ncbi:roadblock/LC7 domain-containing protein [Streptomyces sp. Je 1-79]|uniref:roadblock/LC7 domain-containing protein n=1 Tax=Streptomyces sp. Je 1-79 TaxID=2943847 RepID=UPI0021A59A6D|nr:roadblock/LC7 domain-containing protein [Streptomyces sp. Je 1-79]MCT4351815.1 roadblock/LC7 domain-containing protein [Streptomyces sp. Je 1-79]